MFEKKKVRQNKSVVLRCLSAAVHCDSVITKYSPLRSSVQIYCEQSWTTGANLLVPWFSFPFHMQGSCSQQGLHTLEERKQSQCLSKEVYPCGATCVLKNVRKGLLSLYQCTSKAGRSKNDCARNLRSFSWPFTPENYVAI